MAAPTTKSEILSTEEWLIECEQLQIVCPIFMIDHPPRKMSVSLLVAHAGIPIGTDGRNARTLVCKIRKQNFFLDIINDDNVYKFIHYDKKGDTIISTSLFAMVQKLGGFRKKNDIMNMIFYCGESFAELRKDYICKYIAKFINNMFSKPIGHLTERIFLVNGKEMTVFGLCVFDYDNVETFKKDYPRLSDFNISLYGNPKTDN
jgi:hypothetical protein